VGGGSIEVLGISEIIMPELDKGGLFKGKKVPTERGKAYSEAHQRHQESTDRLAGRMENDPERIHANAIFEKHLREVIDTEEWKVTPIDNADISKIIGVRYNEVGFPGMARLHTVDGIFLLKKEDNGAWKVMEPFPTQQGGAYRQLDDQYQQNFHKQYPLDALLPAIDEAQKRADAETSSAG